jgi:hypothetical protein
MATVADCRDFRKQFESLEPSGVYACQTADDAPWQLLGIAGRLSSAHAREQRFIRQFNEIATRAGLRLLRASRAHAFDAWLNEIRHRTPHHFTAAGGEGFTADRREIPIAQIVPPGAGEREWRFLEAVHAADVMRRETAIRRLIPASSPGDDPRCFIVEPSEDDRYVIVDGEWLYRDCVTRQQSIVTCSMRGQTTKATGTGGVLQHLAAASRELCNLLETDAVEAQARESERVRQPNDRENSAPPTNIFRRQTGGRWEVSYGSDRCVVLKHVEGMTLIRRLLMSPGELIRATECLGADPTVDAGRLIAAPVNEDHATTANAEGIPAIDTRARREAADRVRELQKEREHAQERSDDAKIEEIEKELAAIEKITTAALARHGRVRRLGSDREKARQAVLRRYKTALRLLEQSAPMLATHLRQSIRSGSMFVYQPNPPVEWTT